MKRGVLGTALLLTISLMPAHAATPPKAGTTCSKAGLTRTYTGKKFTCIKSGKRLVWDKGAAVAKPIAAPVASPTPTPTPTLIPNSSPTASPIPSSTSSPLAYSPPSEPGDNVELCKMKELSQRRGYTWAGFPELNPYTQNTGTVKWALIPIDFVDLPGEKDFRSRVDNQMRLLSEWYESVSDGKLKIEWVVADRWTTLPGLSSDYPVTKTTGVNNTPGGIKLFKTAMAEADPHFDFTNVQTVNFLLPINQNIANEGEQGFPWDQHVKEVETQEGRISSFTIPGKYQTWPDHPFWSYWAHEFGHAIGLPHVGGNSGPTPPFNPWDIMGGQDGPSKELSGWIRFLSRWMSDDRIYCKDATKVNNIEITLVPLSSNDAGVKLAIFPFSSSKALLIESRRVTKYSCTTPSARNGVLVYILDLTLGHGQDFLVPISPSGRVLEERATCNGTLSISTPNPLLVSGDKVSFEGLTVEVIKHSNLDQVIVRR